MNPENGQHASFWPRMLASIIDTSLFFLLHTVFWQYLAQSTSASNLMLNLFVYLLVILSPLGFAYQVLLPYYFGGTPGKLITGLKIISQNNHPLTFKKMFFRQTIGYMFSMTFFGLGYLAIFKHPKRFAWHDEASGSQVITVKNFWYLGLIALIISTGLSITFIMQTLTNIAGNNPLQTDVRNLYREFSYQMEEAEKATQENAPAQVSQKFIDDTQKMYKLMETDQGETAEKSANDLLKSAQNQNEKALGYMILGDFYLTKRDYTNAKPNFEESLKISDQLPNTLAGLAAIYIQEKNYQKAREFGEKAVAINPQGPRNNYNLGIALVELGESDKGLYYLEKALEYQPNEPTIKEAIEWAKTK